MKEHPWIKYFTWKELYEKTIEPPFIPKQGDNFDAKYCNAADKLGLNTKEKYESYLKNENYKFAFMGFTHCPVNTEEELIRKDTVLDSNKSNPIKKEHLKAMRFDNPHASIRNISNISLNFERNTNVNSSLNNNGKDSSFISLNSNPKNNRNSSELENRFIKMKNQSVSSSSSTFSLLRQYRMSNSSQNSTSASVNFIKPRSGGST